MGLFDEPFLSVKHMLGAKINDDGDVDDKEINRQTKTLIPMLKSLKKATGVNLGQIMTKCCEEF